MRLLKIDFNKQYITVYENKTELAVYEFDKNNMPTKEELEQTRLEEHKDKA